MTESLPILPSQPRIVPRAEHGISRKDISANALRVLYRLRDGGFQGYLVGGAVRDLLVGGHPKDFDVATDATPEQVKALFRNCRLIGRRFRLAHVVYGKEIIEVATFRANAAGDDGDRETDDGGRIVRDNVYGTIEDDVPAGQENYIPLNAELSKVWPVITTRREPLPDAAEWDGKPDKLRELQR